MLPTRLFDTHRKNGKNTGPRINEQMSCCFVIGDFASQAPRSSNGSDLCPHENGCLICLYCPACHRPIRLHLQTLPVQDASKMEMENKEEQEEQKKRRQTWIVAELQKQQEEQARWDVKETGLLKLFDQRGAKLECESIVIELLQWRSLCSMTPMQFSSEFRFVLLQHFPCIYGLLARPVVQRFWTIVKFWRKVKGLRYEYQCPHGKRAALVSLVDHELRRVYPGTWDARHVCIVRVCFTFCDNNCTRTDKLLIYLDSDEITWFR